MRKLLLALTAFLVFTGQLLAQKTITGKVTDDKGSPIPNASVLVKGSSVGTTTKADGTYSLTVPANARTLVFSSVGMDLREVTIGSSSVINAELSSVVTDLSEVVVTVPYGTVKKTAFTGAEATVTAKSLDKQQVTSVTKALEGLVPGIITTNGGGAPGSGASILIRGFSSINGSSSPLYVLNGIVYEGSINALNMDDIESVTILKDAAAIALYGARAAGGVIMITTKTGKRGKTTVDGSLRQSYLTRGIPEYDRLNPQEYYEMMWEATRNEFYYAQGKTLAEAGQLASTQLTDANHLVYNAYNVPGAQLVDPTTGKLNPNAQLLWNESWEDALFRTASRTNATVSLSGATDKSSYRLSMGYLNEEGIMKFTDYKRYNFRLDVRTQPSSWINGGMTLDGGYTTNNGVLGTGSFTSNPFYYSRNMGPIYPVYQHDLTTGALVTDPLTGKPMLDWGVPTQMGARPYAANSNLVGSLDLDDRSSENFNGNANTFLEVKFLKDFRLKSTLGVNLYDQNATTYQNNQFGDAQNVQGRSTKSSFRQITLTLNEILTWEKEFGMHHVRVLAGHENYKYQDKSLSATRIGFQFPGYTDIVNATATEGAPSSSQDFHRIESYLAQVNYDFNQKYLISGSYRRDGTSRFAPENRWGDFFGGGIGWRISQEDFMKNVRWLNELKLRASYGEVGQEAGIGSYYNYIQYYFPDGFGQFTPTTVQANPDLVWETNKKLNIGIDFMAFHNRFQGTIEWFDNESDKLLFEVPSSINRGAGGYSSILQNVGANKNTGIEIQLGYTVIRGKNFNWRVDFNLTHIKNEITKLPDNIKEDGTVVGNKKWTIGHSIYDFWLREFAGVDASTGEALYYKDILGTDGKPTGERVLTNNITQASYYYNGSAIPKWLGGLTNSFSYKNFELSILLTFASGNKFYDGNYAGLMASYGYGTAWHTDILQRWQKPGDVTNVPKVQNAIANQDGASTRFLFDGSYLNIKNITLSYSLPKTMLSKIGITGTQVFANVDNAWLFTAKKGMDPQRSFTGNSDASYTPYRTMTIGLNLNL